MNLYRDSATATWITWWSKWLDDISERTERPTFQFFFHIDHLVVFDSHLKNLLENIWLQIEKYLGGSWMFKKRKDESKQEPNHVFIAPISEPFFYPIFFFFRFILIMQTQNINAQLP